MKLSIYVKDIEYWQQKFYTILSDIMKFTWFNVNLMENNTNNLQLNVCKVMQSLDLKWTLEAVQVGEEETTSLQLFEYSHITKSSIDPDLGKQWTATEGLEHTSDLEDIWQWNLTSWSVLSCSLDHQHERKPSTTSWRGRHEK